MVGRYLMGILAAAGVIAPAAAAHHSEPDCYWGQNVLPQSGPLRVTAEHPRMMEACDGTRLTIRLALDRDFVIQASSQPRTDPQEPVAEESRKTDKRERNRQPRCKRRKRGKAKCTHAYARQR